MAFYKGSDGWEQYRAIGSGRQQGNALIVISVHQCAPRLMCRSICFSRTHTTVSDPFKSTPLTIIDRLVFVVNFVLRERRVSAGIIWAGLVLFVLHIGRIVVRARTASGSPIADHTIPVVIDL